MEKVRESIVVAMTVDGVIGAGAGLPWHLPQELQHFRTLTWGGTLVMGRRTFEAIGRPLPGRRTVVVSTTLVPQPGITVCADFAAAVAEALRHPEPVFYIGGRTIFRQALERVADLFVSWIDGQHAGEVVFPAWERSAWIETACTPHPGFTFCRYRRRTPAATP